MLASALGLSYRAHQGVRAGPPRHRWLVETRVVETRPSVCKTDVLPLSLYPQGDTISGLKPVTADVGPCVELGGIGPPSSGHQESDLRACPVFPGGHAAFGGECLPPPPTLFRREVGNSGLRVLVDSAPLGRRRYRGLDGHQGLLCQPSHVLCGNSFVAVCVFCPLFYASSEGGSHAVRQHPKSNPVSPVFYCSGCRGSRTLHLQ